MAKRKDEHLLNLVADTPWPVGVVLGLIAFFGIRDVIGPVLSHSGNAVLAALGRQISAGALNALSWALLAAFWMAALASFFRRRHRQRLLQTQTGLDSLRAMSWAEFERVVGEAFRQQGYVIEETGLGGADGGIDLMLRRHGETTLVQCKQWQRRKVDVHIVREMYGLLTHHRAQYVKIVAIGDFTTEARRFAEGKPIELVHGESLLALVRQGQMHARPSTHAARPAPVPTPAVTTTDIPAKPSCPRCDKIMVQRVNRRNGDTFWGCQDFPTCQGTRTMDVAGSQGRT